MYDYLSEHYAAWFPALPSCQAFNQRLNQLTEVLPVLVFELLVPLQMRESYFDDFVFNTDCLLDSLPVMLARRNRSVKAKVARSIANQGDCASKQIYYHGVKLHLLGRREVRRLPQPEMVKITAASVFDLQVLEELQGAILGNLFADKAYKDASLEREFETGGVVVCTPDKKKKQQEVYEAGKSGLWSRFVSAMRQPIESLFHWINEKSGLQNGSKIRSAKGLLIHCYGKLAAALFMLRFNS